MRYILPQTDIIFYYYRAIPFFKKLLEADHESIVVGARQALFLIYELGCLEKFEGDTSASEEMNAETEVKVTFISLTL